MDSPLLVLSFYLYAVSKHKLGLAQYKYKRTKITHSFLAAVNSLLKGLNINLKTIKLSVITRRRGKNAVYIIDKTIPTIKADVSPG